MRISLLKVVYNVSLIKQLRGDWKDMVTKTRNKKKNLLTDEQIEQYCQSVEKLLIDINDRRSMRKSRKVNRKEEEYLASEEDNQMISSN